MGDMPCAFSTQARTVAGLCLIATVSAWRVCSEQLHPLYCPLLQSLLPPEAEMPSVAGACGWWTPCALEDMVCGPAVRLAAGVVTGIAAWLA